MAIYIRSAELGLFVGEFLGAGLFQKTEGVSGDVNEEHPVVFGSRQEAEKYLQGWSGGIADCRVVDEDVITTSVSED